MKVFVIAGEASGDALGQAVMAGLKELSPDITFEGVGGPLMAGEGLSSLFDMTELSVMGLLEILPKYLHLKRRLNQTIEAVLKADPDVLLTIDSPDFCLRVAKAVKTRRKSIKTVHYVAPSVWAWRPKRAEKMRPFVDHVLALLPFEPAHMEAAGVPCTFVGHPIATEEQATDEQAAQYRSRNHIKGPMVLVLPGSRASEIRRLGPIFEETLWKVAAERGELQVVLPVAPGQGGLIRQLIADWPRKPILLPPAFDEASLAEKRAVFKGADVALAASGTVSLELAVAGTPMVIAYDMNLVTRAIMQRMLLTDTVTLVNLVSETRAVPEYIGAKCKSDDIAQGLLDVMDGPEAQVEAMALTMERLGQGGEAPGLRAARAVIGVVEG